MLVHYDVAAGLEDENWREALVISDVEGVGNR